MKSFFSVKNNCVGRPDVFNKWTFCWPALLGGKSTTMISQNAYVGKGMLGQ